jgi:stage V sporulation protein D (sporulation-specific penicillin-binding protein)
MIAAAPMEDPQFTVLVVVDDPKNGGFGSTVAAPAVKEITEELIKYMNIRPTLTDGKAAEDQQAKVMVPALKGMTISDAKKALKAAGLKPSVQSASGNTDFEVAAQYPENGVYIEPGGLVYLYDQ